MSAEAVIDAARRLVKHNACLTAAALKLSKTPYPPTPPTCECTYCKLKAALDAFDLETAPGAPAVTLAPGTLAIAEAINKSWKAKPPGHVDQRGVDFACEECGALAGSFLERGWYRCRACGYPGQ